MLSEKQKTNISKYIALVLRHKPEEANLTLNKEGYCNTNDLIKAIRNKFGKFSMEDLETIVAEDSKGRYSFNKYKTMIRANQGHSTNQVDITFKEVVPPDVLYHGTATRFVNSIYESGLKPMSRQYVHLSKDEDTAVKVGSRHGDLFMFKVNSKQMYEDGYKFYLSENGVYLTKEVPVKYLSPCDSFYN